MRISVIDLGTNTFNLLIVETEEDQSYKIIYNNKLPVKLGKSGIDKKEIRPDAITRGMNAIERHLQTIREYKVEKTFAFATSAVRSARNGEQFVKMIQQKFNLEVKIINGDREAEFIYYGVKQAVPMNHEKVLILDIGGGSNEFIIADRDNIYWKKSYPLGVARLLAKFKPGDPITIEEIEFISNYLEERLSDLFEEFRKHKITTLVGASGSFETIAAMIRADDPHFESETGTQPQSVNIDLGDFENLYQKLINSTLKERKQMKGLESMRLEMIVVATLIVKFIIQKLKMTRLIQSNFALKEGVIYELLNINEAALY
jgi:exopolyphosphatase / guanosine-5'-triphosphate,3'-diphosphate pyrophosphatase